MSNARARKVRTAPIRNNHTIRGDGSDTAHDSVYCKSRGRSVSLADCATCPDNIKANAAPGGDGSVTCWSETLELDRPPGRRATRVDFREAALRTTVGEVMARGAISVTPDMTADAIASLFIERGIRAAPVVDEAGKLMGIISEADLLRLRSSQGHAREASDAAAKPVAATVNEIMTPVVHALPDAAPIAYAFGLLAAKALREVPIVSDDGLLVGMLTSTDLLSWAARDLGYVV